MLNDSEDRELNVTAFCNIVDNLIVKLFSLFVKVQNQSFKIKTFEDTMLKLDEVFTNTAVTSEMRTANNTKIAGEIRKMREN